MLILTVCGALFVGFALGTVFGCVAVHLAESYVRPTPEEREAWPNERRQP